MIQDTVPIDLEPEKTHSEIPHSETLNPQTDPSADAPPITTHPSPPTSTKRGRPPVFDALKQHTLLRLVAVGFSTRRAARLVGVSPSTVREKARNSPPFACGYEDAKAQAIPALAENVYHAGQRSWRASAWLLERLRPSDFGRRIALGPDRAKLQELKRQEALVVSRDRDAVLDEHTIRRFFFRMFNNREAQTIAKYYLRYVLHAQLNHDQATGECEVIGPTGHYDFDDPGNSLEVPVAGDQTQGSSDDSTDVSVPECPTHAGCVLTDDTPLAIAQPIIHHSNCCAPTPSANNSPPSAAVTSPQMQAPQPEEPPDAAPAT